MCLSGNRSQMTSKCRDKQKKKIGTQGAAKCVTDALTTFGCLLLSITEQTHSNSESICLCDTEAKELLIMTSSMCLYVRTNQKA